MKRAIVILALLASPAAAQDAKLTEGFAEGFTFHSIFAKGHKFDPDGAVVYSKNGEDTHVAAVRPGAVPCVFISTSLNLNEGAGSTPVVLLEETYDLRGASFTADPKHEFAPPGGVYLSMTAPKILCRVSTGGNPGKLSRTAQCIDKFEATIEERMMPAFSAAAAQFKSLCKWK